MRCNELMQWAAAKPLTEKKYNQRSGGGRVIFAYDMLYSLRCFYKSGISMQFL